MPGGARAGTAGKVDSTWGVNRRPGESKLICALRQGNLYVEETWRRQRMLVFFLLIAGVGTTAFEVFTGEWKKSGGNPITWIGIFLYVPLALILLAVLLLHRRRSYVEAREDGLRFSTLLSGITIPYTAIRSAKSGPLAANFESKERRRYLRPNVRPLLGKPALYVRVREEDVDLAQLQRKLGPIVVTGDTIVMPVNDPDALSWQVVGKLPERQNVNLGGRRRGRRRRR